MALAPGTQIGPYEVTAQIGSGGMGEVYRATDTKLKRPVAIKLLPESVARDPDRLARFQREAEVLAALNHPNIAAIHRLEETDGLKALVMELVEGPTLADRLAHGPIPLDEALPIAQQIVEALEAAHEQAIIHRDLKPANIKVRDDGRVKVLDFGLAKALEPASTQGASPSATMSPTITSPALTMQGVILGTAAYMSPEQARGKPVDRRTDVWAFGCVLYEMLTGRRAFEGEDISDTLGNVLKVEPDWHALPDAVPARIRQVLRMCLRKDRKQRAGDMQDVRLALAGAFETVPSPTAPAAPVRATPRGRALFIVGLLVGGVVATAAVTMLWAPWRTPPPAAPLSLNADLGADVSLVTAGGPAVVLSPDGQIMAFVATTASLAYTPSHLFVRRLQELRAAAVPGTDGASDPFFSPDAHWIAFFADGMLKKVGVGGGAVVTLCEARLERGGDWAPDGTIVFATSEGPMMRVSSAGGTPMPLTTLDPGLETQRWPQVLDGGAAVLYTANTGASSGAAHLVVQPLPSGPSTVVQENATFGRFVPSGHLLYTHNGKLFAEPFDLKRRAVTGAAAPVLEDLTVSDSAQFAVSAEGTLVYTSSAQARTKDASIVSMDRQGRTTLLRAAPSPWADPSFSPDGRQLALYLPNGSQTDIWTDDLARDSLTRVTFDPGDDVLPVWTPDGRGLAFASSHGKTMNIYWRRADGTGEVQRLTESDHAQYPTSWHPSGKLLAFFEMNPPNGRDLMILPLDGDEASGWKPGKPTVFLNTPFDEGFSEFSPDGRWIAYGSNESGRNEVYVRPFPSGVGKWQISAEGGGLPHWSRTHHELLFESLDGHVMVASYTVEAGAFRADKPGRWTPTPFLTRGFGWDFALAPDGEHVAIAPQADNSAGATQHTTVFIFNFFDELRRLAPVASR